MDVKLQLAGELKESIEIVHSTDYPRYLATMLPVFLRILVNADPTYPKLRNIVLEIIHRFPHNDTLKNYASDMMKALLFVLQFDNEENAVVGLKIIVDLHKNYKLLLEDHVQPFLDLVKEMYQNMELTVQMVFADEQNPKLQSSMFSFKVLTECPVIIALLFSLHRKFVANNIPEFALILQPKKQREAHLKAAKEGTIFLGKSPLVTQTTAYVDLKALQVKTVSFIAYVMRSFLQAVKPYQEQVAEGVMTLMKDCPPDASTIRKELLVAVRHLWYTDFRVAFIPHLDILLDEDVIIGSGVTCRETLRPLGHSVLVDLIHHVRAELSLQQISRIIYIYSKNLHDPRFPPQVQTMCCKLLLSMVENIVKQPSKDDVRHLLMRTLDAFSQRLGSLKDVFAAAKDHPQSDQQTIDAYFDIGLSQPIHTASVLLDTTPADAIKDYRLQFRNLLLGAKTTMYNLSQSNLMPKEYQDNISETLFSEELTIFRSMFQSGLECFKYYLPPPEPEAIPSYSAPLAANALTNGSLSKDDKELIDAFASIFTLVEPFIFQEILAENLDNLIQLSIQNPAFCAVSQHFLSATAVSANYGGLLLRYLTERLEDLGSADKQLAYTLFKHFKLSFMAVNAFPEHNEGVLKPHLSKIIMNCLKCASNTTDTCFYFWLLRTLFRSIGGGKFETLYQEVFPLLQVLLENLNSLLAAAKSSHMKELFVELCLTVPVRLSVLLPYLSYLMRPLVIALQAGPELVSQSLRTLELCVDNLNQEFLEPIILPVMDELMGALWSHLKPAPYNQTHSTTALRILGKFGGRNRRLLRDQSPLQYNPKIQSALNMRVILSEQPVDWDNKDQLERFSICLDDAMDTCIQVLCAKEDAVEPAFQFAKSCLVLIMDMHLGEGFDTDAIINKFKIIVKDRQTQQSDSNPDPFIEPLATPRTRINALEQSFSKVLVALFASASVPQLEAEAWQVIDGLIEYFAIFSIEECVVADQVHPRGPVNGFELLRIHALSKLNGLFDAVVKTMSSGIYEREQVAEKVLVKLHESALHILGTQHLVEQLASFNILASRFSSSCYQSDWFMKTATDTLHHILRVCHSNMDDGETTKFNSLLSLLISELSNSNKSVRDAVQSMFVTLTEIKNTQIPDLLMPVRDRLVAPIFTKPLRALPFALQIGHIDAITYCLNLRPSLLQFNDELIRYLHEALALADAEDQALASKGSHFKSAVSVINLRVVCIKLLSAAMSAPEFSSSPREATTRARIIAVFFKSLYAKSPEVVDQQHKLPKDLLQSGLRPILVNLSDHRRLTVPGLEGLARLLELLTNYFKVEIGRKLLDHLKQWATPEKLQEASGKSILDVEEIRIIVSILDIFHLLPASANIFLSDVIASVIELESKVHRVRSSPFRAPLIRFMNRYASESVDFLMQRMNSNTHAQLLVSVLMDPSAGPLLEDVKQKTLGNTPFWSQFSNNDVLIERHSFYLIHLLSQDASWLQHNKETFRSVFLQYKQREAEDNGSISRNRVAKCLYEVLMRLCQENAEDPSLLFDVVNGLVDPDLIDPGFILRFVFEWFKTFSNENRRIVFESFLDLVNQWQLEQKVLFLRFLIVPMLMTSNQVEDIVSAESVQKFLNTVWAPVSAELADSKNGDLDAFTVELLQLTSLLVARIPQVVSDFRKDVIKFAWALLKVEDITVKQAAYALLARFIREYETPPKIVTQIYVAQLRTHQQEGKNLVRQVLDTMLPALPQRFAQDNDPTRAPVWVQWIRKVLIDDGHNVAQLAAIYQLLIRNADQFFSCREHFIMNIVSSLAKLGLSSNSTTETRLLTIELGELLLKWDEQERQEASQNMVVDDDNQMDVDEGQGANYRQMVINCMLRFCLALHDANSKPLFSRALDLLKKYFAVWPDTKTPIQQMDKLADLPLDSEVALNMALIAAETLQACLESMPAEAVMESLQHINKVVAHWINCENPPLMQLVSNIVKLTFKAIDTLGDSQDKQSFVRTVDGVIISGLRGLSNISGVKSLLLASYTNRQDTTLSSQMLRAHVPDIIKVLQALINDTTQQPVTGMTEPNADVIKALLLLLNSQCAHLGEGRKVFVQSLTTIIDQPEYGELHVAILDMLRVWIFEETSFPTIKEKATIAVKMLAFENYNQDLFTSFLELVADIYTRDAFARSELTVRLEPAFLLGTMSQTPVRTRFMSLLDKSIPSNADTRLKYVLGVQSWEGLSKHFWIQQATDILMGSMVPDVSLLLCATGAKMTTPGKAKLTKSLMLRKFFKTLGSMQSGELWNALRGFMHKDQKLVYDLWTHLFPMFWSTLAGQDRHDVAKHMIALLSQGYHMEQAEARPNVIQALLEGVCNCAPIVPLPPPLVKYLGQHYNAWHIALELLHKSNMDIKGILGSSSKEEEKIRETILDATAALYNDLSEEDYFAGIWRRKCLFSETNCAISFEQLGMWTVAQKHYENAQAKARTGALPFQESEYTLWEKHWVKSTKQLQQWDILTDLAKHENDAELLLEASWRLSDWNAEKDILKETLQVLPEPPTARKRLFEAYLLLLKATDSNEFAELHKIQEDGMQLCLKQWHQLPQIVTCSHIPVLHSFQQFVELQEARNIQLNLFETNVQNIEAKSQEMKGTLQTWRERLPNLWDDISVWSDLIAWRQHIFSSVNRTYLPLIPQIPNTTGNPSSSYAYRGYHETAWIINRFAHVARKHQLPEDIINNTNLHYFTAPQKAEFFTLKAQFFSYLNLFQEAGESYASAVHIDVKSSKAWAAWGEYNDRLFAANGELSKAGDAINCYLNAIGLVGCKQPRRYIARILWLLSLDDEQGSLLNVFNSYKGEIQLWYWITFIPQLLTGLNGKEAPAAHSILLRIAKTHPQALHFQLRTAKEDLNVLKRQHNASLSKQSEANSTENSEQIKQEKEEDQQLRRKPWEYVEELMGILKTAFPLLALSMETMVDQILQRLKPTTDEDIYRLIVALLNDGVQMYLTQLAKDPKDEGTLFRLWRDRLETLLDSRPMTQYLEHYSPYLAEFEYQKFDEVEVPGQYFAIRENSKNFLKIDRFEPLIDVVRGHSGCHRSIIVRGHDGSLHPFMVQHPAAKQCRREERIIQIIMDRQKETRRRNILFHLPTIVPLAPQIRLVQDDRSYATLQEIYEDYTQSQGFKKDDPIIFHIQKIKEVYSNGEEMAKRGKVELLNIKTEIMNAVAEKMIPDFILTKFFQRKMKSYMDLWTVRKRFTKQMAAVTFMTYLLSIGHRYPQKFHISAETGNIWASELNPIISNATFLFTSNEAVPFRLTPNIQHFMTPVGIEGLFTACLMSIGRSLTEPVNEMHDYLAVFVRDELLTWQQMGRRQPVQDGQLRDHVHQNVDLLLKRAQALSCKVEREQGADRLQPVNQTILDLVSHAVNPLKLAQMDVAFLPQL
ncbi:hypothetical protein EDD86DRAFT_232632 [Gorgonomyces haynaldii]|nr:hypothetical protein EDD86DRAFT_232632 [Gorgonomyces haynaldii]